MLNNYKLSNLIFLAIIGLNFVTEPSMSFPAPSQYKQGGVDAKFIKDNFYPESSVNNIWTRKVDLNNDKIPEILVVNGNSKWCGSAGCATTVYSYLNGKWQEVLSFTGNGVIERNTTTKGWKDISASPNERINPVWVFNGKEYNLGYLLDTKHNLKITPQDTSANIIGETNAFDGAGTNYPVRQKLTNNESIYIHGFVKTSSGQTWYVGYTSQADRYNPFYVHKSNVSIN